MRSFGLIGGNFQIRKLGVAFEVGSYKADIVSACPSLPFRWATMSNPHLAYCQQDKGLLANLHDTEM